MLSGVEYKKIVPEGILITVNGEVRGKLPNLHRVHLFFPSFPRLYEYTFLILNNLFYLFDLSRKSCSRLTRWSCALARKATGPSPHPSERYKSYHYFFFLQIIVHPVIGGSRGMRLFLFRSFLRWIVMGWWLMVLCAGAWEGAVDRRRRLQGRWTRCKGGDRSGFQARRQARVRDKK